MQQSMSELKLDVNQGVNNGKKSEFGLFDFSMNKPTGEFNTTTGALGMNSNSF